MVRGSARERASPASWDSEWRTVKLGEREVLVEVEEVEGEREREVEVEVEGEVEVEDCLRSTSNS